MLTVEIPTEEQRAKRQCPECRIYMGCHRTSCSQLDKTDRVAMRHAYEVDAILNAKAR